MFLKNFHLKFFGYLVFCNTLLVSFGKAIDSGESNPWQNASNMIYKKFLKLRTLPFEDCGSTFDIIYLSISSCNTIPCEMSRGSKPLVNVIFDDNGKNTSFLKHRVSWIFNAIKSRATISPDPCDGDHACLLESSDGKSYFANLFVNQSLPCIGGTMLWEAVDESGEVVICFKIPVVITN